ncbi:30S ribosomal protein S6 [Thalassoglobus polymorphus]|uniref:Small ribosomal subunit protein bS6 n=1 Tax=Thalassoglobus polymorphus TaxID=2527994 RepID=A0A517QRY9_9PLAN|nr:30S ribosomal protein S6 [Thalassoglobus polymorphus]QDT34385.1 30S ribosomal protein S6 [Thalassoglobus polymorphus]
MAERLYECMFLLDSGRYAQDPQGTEKIVQEILERCEAELVVSTPWQEGKLAYEIDGHRKGLHYLTYFKMDASQVTAFARICKLNEVVIRQLLLDHDEKLFSLLTQQVQPPESEESQEEPVAVGAGAEKSSTDDASSTEGDK